MKLGIIVVLVLGVIAAACAALLVGMLGVGSPAAAKAPSGIEVAVAKASLPAMTVMTLDLVAKQSVSRNELPQGQGQLVNPTRVIGRVLSVPVVEGQVLTESCFILEGTGAQLVAAIPDGKRAYTLHLNSRSVPDSLLLYPGSMVDILFSFRMSGRDALGEAGCLTILSGIQVVVVQGDSVVSNPEEDKNSQARRSSGNVNVTVIVDPKQAEALQLLADNGTISLLVRNPLDKSTGDGQTMVLSQGQLAALSMLLTAEGVAAPQAGQGLEAWLAERLLPAKDSNQPKPAEPERTVEDRATSYPRSAAPQPRIQEQYQNRAKQRWQIDEIRGPERRTKEFDLQPSDNFGQNQPK